ncbi:DUF928 domain-containing protein [Nostoc sp. TCL26-01]|uniref:DUF928 domain-containing protein n=1 Tax=Nostoc sp. TCL26-01 TaxID=2576904 RepID=UPI0015BD055B|nr:DUF928 domain-containing protein [Nostoc sp. TCL26-01]QLE59821.1 DUF928 domain-containing protein [Nostoc sp. TCL26-01]
MSRKKLLHQFITLSCAVTPALISFDGFGILLKSDVNFPLNSTLVLASEQLKSSPAPSAKKQRNVVDRVRAFKFPKNGSSRFCKKNNVCKDAVVRGEVFKALVFKDENNPDEQFGLTYAEFPTFWLYFEDQSQITSERSVTVRFTLFDDQTNTKVYQTDFQLTGGTGIFNFQLPQTAPPLKIGKSYFWQFDILYGEKNEHIWLSESGVIERQSPPSTQAIQLEKSSPWDRIILYGENGIWYEMLNELAQLRRLNPDDPEIKEAWFTLLDRPDVILSSLKSQPLTSCCSIAK